MDAQPGVFFFFFRAGGPGADGDEHAEHSPCILMRNILQQMDLTSNRAFIFSVSFRPPPRRAG